MNVRESMYANSAPLVVPVVAIKVVRNKIPSAARNYELTGVEFQNYFITPDMARGGTVGETMTFREAISRLII